MMNKEAFFKTLIDDDDPILIREKNEARTYDTPLRLAPAFRWLRGIRSNEIDLREGAKLISK